MFPQTFPQKGVSQSVTFEVFGRCGKLLDYKYYLYYLPLLKPKTCRVEISFGIFLADNQDKQD
jgi:hypothetical protein